ncbi:MAG TPA: type II toxin-antitoxin system VapC family toxin [Gemmatimonadaceae bacterium]|nr:type II toxin-antitoxin system VapC family toxin [Gemmatimonadaceae bacterium]
MVIDTSALLAMLLGEAEAERMVGAIAADPVRLVGTPTLVEAAAVMTARHGRGGEVALDALAERLSLETVPFSADAASFARDGYRRYGRGVGDPGVLNLGDCFAYGLAMALDEPLLFKGDDFVRTDVRPVAY